MSLSRDLRAAPRSPGSRRVHRLTLEQAPPLPLQLSQDGHPGLAVRKDCEEGNKWGEVGEGGGIYLCDIS